MNAAAAPATRSVTHGDRMGVALLVSLMVHAIVILGIGFAFVMPKPRVPTLDVILINTSNAQAPKKADFLAQANNAGGGNSDKVHRPGSPFSGPLPVPTRGIVPAPVLPQAPRLTTTSGPKVLVTHGPSKARVASSHDAHVAPQPAPREGLVPVRRRLEMARLAQEVRRKQEAYAHRPHRKYVSANTRSVADAAYQVAWVHRIERVGNLHYPSAARRRHLFGNVILSVTIGRDGHIRAVTINESSGYRVLDDAAVRIVHLAAPFPPIPDESDASGHRIDELVITRTWQFLPGNHLQTRGVTSK